MKFEEKLEQLLRTKKYEHLSISEKKYVERFVNPAEYARMRLIICMGQHQMKTPISYPTPSIKKNLLGAISAKKQQQKTVFSVFNNIAEYRLPVWQAAAVMAGFIFLFTLGKKDLSTDLAASEMNPHVVLVDTVFETKYDTVYKEAPSSLIGKNLNVSPKKLHQYTQHKQVSKKAIPQMTRQMRARDFSELAFVTQANILLADSVLSNDMKTTDFHWNEKSIGRNAQADEALLEFLDTSQGNW